MGFARLNHLMFIVVLLSLGLMFSVLSLAIVWPVEDFSKTEIPTVAAERRKVEAIVNAAVSLLDFGDSLQFPLQRPLEDPPPAPIQEQPQIPTTPSPPPQSLAAELIGTAVDTSKERSTAWIKATGPKSLKIRIGDVLEGMPGNPKVKSIEQRSVVFDVQGAEVELQMPASKSGAFSEC